MSSEVNEVRLVMLDQVRRCEPCSLPPDEIHLSMYRTERQARLKYKQHAAIEKKASAQHTDNYRHQVVTLMACNSHHSDGHAGRYKHSQCHVKGNHRTLQNAGPAR